MSPTYVLLKMYANNAMDFQQVQRHTTTTYITIFYTRHKSLLSYMGKFYFSVRTYIYHVKL